MHAMSFWPTSQVINSNLFLDDPKLPLECFQNLYGQHCDFQMNF